MDIIKAKIKLEKLLKPENNLSNSFYLGRVGFRRPSKRYNQSIEKSIDNAIEISRLSKMINDAEIIATRQLKPKANKFYSLTSELIKGEQYEDVDYGLVEVIKINKNTVTIKTKSGYTENRKPGFIYIK